MLVCRAAVPHLRRQRSGKIVNVSSRSARSTGWFSSVSPEYVAAKIGVIAFTRHLAKELGPHGINVNCLVPGFAISGPKLQAAWDGMAENERQRMLEATPLRRLPRLEELASVVVFLVSEESSYITGAAIDVNGGSFMS
jgi:3-oxoacyl-[acyl-carrier protein] reductase